MGHARQGQAERGAAEMVGVDVAGVLLGVLQQRQQFAGQALGGLLAERQGFHQHGQLVFQPAPQPGGEGVVGADAPGACGQGPAQRQMRLGVLCEKITGRVVQFRQAVEQLLQGVPHLPALLIQLARLATGAVFLAQLRQLRPIAGHGGAAMREQQRRFEAGEVEQQLVADPAAGAGRVFDAAILHGHFQALGIAVAANRQLRTGQTQQRPGWVHKRTPN